MDRRNFLRCLATAAASGVLPRVAMTADDDLYDIGRFGNVRILHLTDTHAQLPPVFFREPSVNIGVGAMRGRPPHLVGHAFLEHFGIAPGSRNAHAFTFLDFQEAAHRYGRMGGFANLKTLIDRLRTDAGPGNSLLLDGGDLWQGSGQAAAMQGADMVEAANLLGIDASTGHWEFTYGEKILRQNLERFKGEFLAQNVFLTEDAAFNDAPAFDAASGRVFKPASVKDIGGLRVAVIGQAFPYVPIAHPEALHARLDLRHPRAGASEARRRYARRRARGCRVAVVPQRHGCRPQARQPCHRHRCHSRRPYSRRGAASSADRQCRRQDLGHECRIEWKISRCARPGREQGRAEGHPLSPAAGLSRSA